MHLPLERMLSTAWRWIICACILAASIGAQARSLEQIHATGTLRICVAGASAAFYQANGEAFARYLKVRPEIIQLASFDEQFHNADGVTVMDASYEPQLMTEGRCDVFPNDLHIASWRTQKLRLVPYYKVRKVIVARQELHTKLKELPDLMGRHAAVQRGTAYDTWLTLTNSNELAAKPVRITYAPTEESIRMVAQGTADFTVLGTDGAFKWVRGDMTRLSIQFPVDEAVEVGWGVQQSAQSLAAELVRFFAESERMGSELDNNWQRYYRISLMEYQVFQASFEADGIDLKTLLAWAAPMVTVMLALLVVMLVWSLRNTNHRREAEEALSKNLEATIEAVAAALESRDPYTAGHQRRVAHLAVAIAQEMGLPQERIDGLRFGALIHDIGKIRVPYELLCKPTRLTKAEFNLIKTHPDVGFDIVKGIDFPWPVATMIHQHHERMDGSGYPQGMMGPDIVLEARILAVADTVEAMASHRPYRPGLGTEAALAEIERGCGQLFDTAVVQACLRLFRERDYSFV